MDEDPTLAEYQRRFPALAAALALDDDAYQAMCARAREFAEYMFSPESVAVATRAVYRSLLAREP